MRTLVFFACALALTVAAHAQQTTSGPRPTDATGTASQQGSATGTGSQQGSPTGTASQQGTDTGTAAQRPSDTAAGKSQQPSDAAATAAMHGPAKPDPALTAAFKDSVGSWRCSGVMMMPKEMGGGEIKTRSQMTIKSDLNGFAYVGDWRVEKTQAFPGAHGKMTWTYNPPSKKFWEFAVDDTGSVMRGESDGEEGGKMVWTEEGTMMGKPSKMRSTIVKNGKSAIDMTFETQGDGGTWAPMGKDSCTKATATASAK